MPELVPDTSQTLASSVSGLFTKAKQNYPLNNLYLKNLRIINNEEGTAGFPLWKEQKF